MPVLPTAAPAPVDGGDPQRLEAAFRRVNGLYLQIERAVRRVVHRAPDCFEETLQRFPLHPPQIALFVTFLRLFLSSPGGELNDLVGRHLDFYYKDVLRLPFREHTPDRAHLLLTLSKAVERFKLERGTRFDAGKDATKVPVAEVAELGRRVVALWPDGVEVPSPLLAEWTHDEQLARAIADVSEDARTRRNERLGVLMNLHRRRGIFPLAQSHSHDAEAALTAGPSQVSDTERFLQAQADASARANAMNQLVWCAEGCEVPRVAYGLTAPKGKWHRGAVILRPPVWRDLSEPDRVAAEQGGRYALRAIIELDRSAPPIVDIGPRAAGCAAPAASTSCRRRQAPASRVQLATAGSVSCRQIHADTSAPGRGAIHRQIDADDTADPGATDQLGHRRAWITDLLLAEELHELGRQCLGRGRASTARRFEAGQAVAFVGGHPSLDRTHRHAHAATSRMGVVTRRDFAHRSARRPAGQHERMDLGDGGVAKQRDGRRGMRRRGRVAHEPEGGSPERRPATGEFVGGGPRPDTAISEHRSGAGERPTIQDEPCCSHRWGRCHRPPRCPAPSRRSRMEPSTTMATRIATMAFPRAVQHVDHIAAAVRSVMVGTSRREAICSRCRSVTPGWTPSNRPAASTRRP